MDIDAHEAKKREWQRLDRLKQDAPAYFMKATFANYQAKTDKQKKTLSRLSECARRIKEFVDTRHGLILWGRMGTGKDHLAVALLETAVRAGYTGRWVQGTRLYEAANATWKQGETPSFVLAPYIRADCLVISDPVFLRNWSQSKAEIFAKLVRDRYDAGKPTWITNNAKDLAQLREMCVPDVYDRIAEKAVIECFDWETHRQTVSIDF